MARITVEDCIDKFPSRFELVLVASNRARKLHSGETPTVEKDNDKNTVIALREIAQESLTGEKLKEDLIEEYQTTSFSEDEDLIEQEEELTDQDENLISQEGSIVQQEASEENLMENISSEEQTNNLENKDELLEMPNSEVTNEEVTSNSDDTDIN